MRMKREVMGVHHHDHVVRRQMPSDGAMDGAAGSDEASPSKKKWLLFNRWTQNATHTHTPHRQKRERARGIHPFSVMVMYVLFISSFRPLLSYVPIRLCRRCGRLPFCIAILLLIMVSRALLEELWDTSLYPALTGIYTLLEDDLIGSDVKCTDTDTDTGTGTLSVKSIVEKRRNGLQTVDEGGTVQAAREVCECLLRPLVKEGGVEDFQGTTRRYGARDWSDGQLAKVEVVSSIAERRQLLMELLDSMHCELHVYQYPIPPGERHTRGKRRRTMLKYCPLSFVSVCPVVSLFSSLSVSAAHQPEPLSLRKVLRAKGNSAYLLESVFWSHTQQLPNFHTISSHGDPSVRSAIASLTAAFAVPTFPTTAVFGHRWDLAVMWKSTLKKWNLGKVCLWRSEGINGMAPSLPRAFVQGG